MTFGARALIRLGALKDNLEVIRSSCPDNCLMAVIKANAYGHGAVAVAQHLEKVDAFAVARLPEALELRAAGVGKPVVLLAGVLDQDELAAAIAHDLQIVVHCPEQIELLQHSAAGELVVWLKFDTGMNRLGFDSQDARALIDTLQHCPAVAQLRLMSHLATADEPGDASTQAQLQRFAKLTRDFDGAVSVANSAAALAWPRPEGKTWIRTGITLFGISPFEDRSAADLGLTPVMHFEARLIAKKPLQKGARVGYKGAYTAPADSTMGVISAGYGDGYTRAFRTGTPVLLNGRRVSLIGNVSMDLITVDLGSGADDKVGDIATLWGPGLPAEEVAPWANAIPYELVCGVMNREASEVIA